MSAKKGIFRSVRPLTPSAASEIAMSVLSLSVGLKIKT